MAAWELGATVSFSHMEVGFVLWHFAAFACVPFESEQCALFGGNLLTRGGGACDIVLMNVVPSVCLELISISHRRNTT